MFTDCSLFISFITVAGSVCVDSVIGLGAVNGLLLVSLSISIIIHIYCFIRYIVYHYFNCVKIHFIQTKI